MHACRLATVIVFTIGMISAPICIESANARSVEKPQPDLVSVLAGIRAHSQQLLSISQPSLYRRHLQSILAFCEDSVLKLEFAGSDRDSQTLELMGYLRTIESGLSNEDAQKPETYLAEGRRSLVLARLSRSDGTLQLYTVTLPAHWDATRIYPLYVQLHGRWSDLPIALVASTFAPQDGGERLNDRAIILVPWLRGNGQWREKNGSEPDVWEAIDDVKTFAKIDSDRRYISGHSWGGDDVWAIVLRTPDLWAAAGIMAGSPVGVPSDSNLVANAQHVPFYLWKGAQDPVPDRQSALEYFRSSLTQVGDPPNVIVAEGVGHNPRPEDGIALQTWLFEHVRHRPDHFSFLIDTAEHRGIWGISVPQKYPDAYLSVEPRVSFECWIEGSLVRIQTANTNRLELSLGPQGLGLSGNVKVVLNGKEVFRGAIPDKSLSFSW